MVRQYKKLADGARLMMVAATAGNLERSEREGDDKPSF
jgi:hypothetical protein